jgi:hypothetical protein
MPIHYSVERAATDNRPKLTSARAFTDYRTKAECLRQNIGANYDDAKDILSGKKKRLFYLWVSMRDSSDGPSAAKAADHDRVWLDMDGGSDTDWPALRDPASLYLGFAYPVVRHEHPTINREQCGRLCFVRAHAVATTKYQRLSEAIERALLACYCLIGNDPVSGDRSVFNLGQMLYAPHQSAVSLIFR